ncbi:MAG: bifunctional phosphoglucose/phosphomannose isomerase [Candidatus Jorgensenbacteria bacterium]|nr:bifunctional phosphoglucose/phosphomannose isomerase [Candidatus Jorgensenbacteria bacterium]
MEEILRSFTGQLSWEPRVENSGQLVKAARVFFCGMGGSRLAGDLVRAALPTRDIIIHADFGVPLHADKDSLVVVSSYSGNTEEALDAFKEAQKRGIPTAVIVGGGKLLELARRENVPTVEIPGKGFPPRLAVGYSVKALLSLIGEKRSLQELSSTSIPDTLAEDGNILAARLKNTIPLIYASRQMGGLAYYWKVVLNETAKVHAFANIFPEAGHNEIEGFDGALDARFTCVILRDTGDDPRLAKRMELLARLCEQKKIPTASLTLAGAHAWERVMRSVMLANWTAYHLAQARGVDPISTPLIEEWKRKLRG